MGKINLDQLANEVMKELNVYQQVSEAAVRKAVTKTAKETVAEIKQQARENFGGTGEYANSWSYKKDPNLKGEYKFSLVVYSEAPHYRLTHLLENGHAKVNGGRVYGRPHIKRGEDIARANLERNIVEAMNNDT